MTFHKILIPLKVNLNYCMPVPFELDLGSSARYMHAFMYAETQGDRKNWKSFGVYRSINLPTAFGAP
jgi:hypothetical protein